jgi:large subunit ribosomal protein L18
MIRKPHSPREARRAKIKVRIRKRIQGTPERPRLVVSRSLRQISAQLVDDVSQKTLITVTSLSKSLKPEIEKTKGKVAAAKLVGKAIGHEAIQRKITHVVFDRNGRLFHGRVKAVAEGAREAGLTF